MMALFCGGNSTIHNELRGSNAIYSECLADLFALALNAIFCLACALLLYLMNKKPNNYRLGSWHRDTWPHYAGHNFRYILFCFLALFNLTQVLEGTVAQSLQSQSQLHLYLPQCIGLFSTCVAICFYHCAESTDNWKYLWNLLVYWVLSLALHSWKVAILFHKGLGIAHLRFDLTWDVIVVYFGLLVIEVVVQVKQCVKPAVKDEGISQTKYHYSFVNLLSKATFVWMSSILRVGYKKALDLADFGALPDSEHSMKFYRKLAKFFSTAKAGSKNSRPSLFKCLVKLCWRMQLLAGLFKLFGDLLRLVGPLAVERIIDYLEMNGQTINTANATVVGGNIYVGLADVFSNGYALCVVVLVAAVLQNTFLHSNYHLVIREAMRCKVALQNLIFDKALKLPVWLMSGTDMSTGKIVNHMSMDCEQIQFVFYFWHNVWSIPLQLCFVIPMLYNTLGLSALIGCCWIVVIIPLQYLLARAMTSLQKQKLVSSDERMQRSNELIQSIKLLKLLSWTDITCRSVKDVRKQEMKCLLKAALLQAVATFLTECGPVFVLITSFVLYPFVQEEALTTSKAITSLAYLGMLGTPFVMFTLITKTFVQGHVSLQRLEKFFALPEVEPPEDTVPNNSPSCPSTGKHALAVEIRGGHFKWGPDTDVVCLKDIDLKIKTGSFTMVVGEVGCGKTALLLSMLGELTREFGSVVFSRETGVAYASQTPWILNATVRENILFGKSFHQQRYDEVLSACALQPDLDLLVSGDQTEVGEKGITLSGGQKQRISLARAMYSDANLVIIDEPFSALDVHVGHQVFHDGIMSLLNDRGRTIVLVTHHVQFMSHADQIIFMSHGRITCRGTFEQLERVLPDFQTSLAAGDGIESSKTKVKDSSITGSQSLVNSASQTSRQNTMDKGVSRDNPLVCQREQEALLAADSRPHHDYPLRDVGSKKNRNPEEEFIRVSCSNLASQAAMSVESLPQIHSGLDVRDSVSSSNNKLSKGKLVTEEERNTGHISKQVYLAYIRACTIGLFCAALFAKFAQHALLTGKDFWISTWSSQSEAQLANATRRHVIYFVGGFSALSAAALVVALSGVMLITMACFKAAQTLHDNLLANVTLAPLRFFETTPVGRILNRFSSDVNTIDERLPTTCLPFAQILFSLLSAAVVNLVATPISLVALIVISVVYFFLQRFFRSSSREMKRLESIARSPIYSQFSETLGGLSTIRAYRDGERFFQSLFKAIDMYSLTFLFLNTANRWLGIRLDYLGALFTFSVALIGVIAGVHGYTTAGFVGLAVVYALNISTLLNWLVRHLTDFEMHSNAVERVLHYTNIDQEQSTVSDKPESKISKDWPHEGRIEFKNASLRYADTLPTVVHELTAVIKGGTKVGLCGRTGSGKSSITLGLFRMIDLCSGSIFIDDVDIGSVPLAELRSRLSIIPQDPALFIGTVRSNLDPYGSVKDDSLLWHALEISQLKGVVSSLEGQLDAEVSEGGANFSVGQRQLFCLARAFLRHAKVLIMDEATASIDLETDYLIQDVIGQVFKDSTVLIVAHRLSTIMNCDYLMVIQDGRLVEYDTPSALQRDKTSLFSSLSASIQPGL